MPEESQVSSVSAAAKAQPRNEPAPVLQRMVEKTLLEPSRRILCYGCGRGVDVSWLRLRKFQVQGYDPHPPFGYSETPSGKFDFVFLIYLLTRLRTEENRKAIIAKAYEFVRPGGYLVLASRHAARHAAQAGLSGREGIFTYFQGLVQGCDVDRVEAPELDPEDHPEDHAFCFLARKSGIYQPRNPITPVNDFEALAMLCARLNTEAVIGLDVETTLDEPRVLCTIQIAIPGHTWLIDALALSDLAPLKSVLENRGVEKVIHNALFEEQMFAKHGIRILGVFDTLPASRKKHRKNVEGGHKLGEVCERELGIYLDKHLQTSDWTQRPLSPEQIKYAAVDAEVLIDLYRIYNPPPPPKTLDLFGVE